MVAWQHSSTGPTGKAGTEPAPAPGSASGRLTVWPQTLMRWLFGSGEPERAAVARAGSAARFQNLCISREAGAGEDAIARLVGERLGWKVYDDELIEAIAHRMSVPIEEVRTLDELAPSKVQDWLLPLREEYYAPQEAYLDHLAKLIEAIGRAGESILVGRGAGFLLPRETTLSVRVIAPLRVRAQRLSERMGVSVRTARRAARDLDRRRGQFDHTMHRAHSNDPHNFDLVLDAHSLGPEIAAEILVQAVRAGRAGTVRDTAEPVSGPGAEKERATTSPAARPGAAPIVPFPTIALPPSAPGPGGPRGAAD